MTDVAETEAADQLAAHAAPVDEELAELLVERTPCS